MPARVIQDASQSPGRDADHDEPKTLVEHLSELRLRVIRCLIALVIGAAIALPFQHIWLRVLIYPSKAALATAARPSVATNDLHVIIGPASDLIRTNNPQIQVFTGTRQIKDVHLGEPVSNGLHLVVTIEKEIDSRLTYLSPTEPFFIKLKIALVAGLLIVLPFVIWQLWLFVAPALYQREQRWIFRLSGFSVLLFWSGLLFAYFLAVPFAMKFFVEFAGPDLASNVTLGNYVGFVSMMLLAFGLVFQLPIILIFLMKTGIVPRAKLIKNRGTVIVILTIAAAIITPTGDAVSLAIMILPLYFLFELSLMLVREKSDLSDVPDQSNKS